EARAQLNTREFLRMLRFGLPSGFNWLFDFGAFVFFANVVVGGLGTTALAAMMSVIQINSVSFMPAFGLASAGAILVGQAIGGGNKDEVPRLVNLTYFVAAVWETVVSISYVVIPTTLLLPFARNAEATDFLTIGKR